MRDLYDLAEMTAPDVLRRVLSDTSKGGSSSLHHRPSRLRMPAKPPMPTQAGDDWLWVEAKEAMLRTVVLAVLNEGKTISVKELAGRVKQILPDAHEGSIANIGTSLDGKLIHRTDQGWTLKEGEQAPVLYKNCIWAPAALLQKQDLASFRRMAIRHLLSTSSDGLQVMQVYRQLQQADWLNTPLSKDLVKADLFVMQEEHKVKRYGSSRKWMLRESSLD